MSLWLEYSIDELMDVQNGYAFKSGEYIDEGPNTFEVLKMGHIEKGGGLRKSPKKDYVPRTEKLERWVLSKDDIVMAMTDMKDNVVILGVPARIDRSDHYVLNQRVARLSLKNPELVDIGFIYSQLKWEEFLFELQSKASSGVQVNLSTSAIKESVLRLPPLSEQKSIAAILSSLEDKIDLLHRQNKTIEAMAVSLFRQWFVEEVQADWEECTLDDVISVKGGTTPSTKVPEYWDGNIRWSTPRDLSGQNSVFLFETERKISEKGLAQIGSGVLPVGTVLLSSRAPIGYLAIADIPVAINQGYIAIVCDKLVSNYFMYLWCLENMNEIKSAGNGSTFEEISKSNFKALTLNIPPKGKLIEFDKVVSPILEKIKKNQKQIRTLEKLRDTLLPKLMSGEVRVV